MTYEASQENRLDLPSHWEPGSLPRRSQPGEPPILDPEDPNDAPTERLQAANHPFSSFVVLPLFALANAGVVLSGDLLATAVTSAVTLGIVLGLVLGKTLGITLATWIAVKSGAGRLPTGTGWPLLVGIAAVAGIGFTVALFITELAFRGEGTELLTDEAKIGVLAGSLIAALLGAGLVALTAPKLPSRQHDPEQQS